MMELKKSKSKLQKAKKAKSPEMTMEMTAATIDGGSQMGAQKKKRDRARSLSVSREGTTRELAKGVENLTTDDKKKRRSKSRDNIRRAEPSSRSKTGADAQVAPIVKQPSSTNLMSPMSPAVEQKSNAAAAPAAAVAAAAAVPPPAPKKENKVWAGEDASRIFIDSLSIVKYKSEYEEISLMTANATKCAISAVNKDRNRNEQYTCLDDNRVLLQNCKQNYINASRVSLPTFPKPVILAQLPRADLAGSVEEFWRMIFHEGIGQLHICASKEDSSSNFAEYYPTNAGGYTYFGAMFVNNRKTEGDAMTTVHTIEVLPDGCSNSLIMQLHLHTYWPALIGPAKYGPAIRAAHQIYQNNDAVVVASSFGSGRPGTLFVLAVCLYQLSKGNVPQLKETVRTVREQRPMAVDSLQQYGFLYLGICHYIKKKLNCPTVAQKVAQFALFCQEATVGED